MDLRVIRGGRSAFPRDPGTASGGAPQGWLGRPAAETIGPAEIGLRPVDVLILVYLGVTTCLLIAFQANLEAWGALSLGHVLFGAALLRAGAVGPPKNRFLRFLREFYPVLAMAIFYAELELLTRLSGTGPHDSILVDLEMRIFGFQPSQDLHTLWPSWILSQYLHAAYFAYYLIPASLLFTLYFRGRWRAFQESLTTLMLAFLSCSVVYIAYPVAGPYHFFGPPEVSDLGGAAASLAHGVVRSGSSVGTAFPSSHTAVAVAVWISALRLSRPVFLMLSVVVPGLVLATVYGGFHYAVDTVAGVLWGLGAGLAGPPLHSFLARRLPRPGADQRVGGGKALSKSWGDP